jgi:hypothetical protein
MNILKMLAANSLASGINIAFRSSAVSSAGTITAPSDIVAGDLLVLYDNAANTSGFPTSVIPSGWASPAIINQTGGSGSNRRVIVSMKIADGTEAGATITGMDGTLLDAKVLIVFSTNGATTSSAFDAAVEITQGDPAQQTINASSGSPPLVCIGFSRIEGGGGATMTPTQDGTAGTGTHIGYYKIYNSSPADVTFDAADGGNNNMLMSFYVEVD